MYIKLCGQRGGEDLGEGKECDQNRFYKRFQVIFLNFNFKKIFKTLRISHMNKSSKKLSMYKDPN